MIKERKKSMISYDTYSIVQLGRGSSAVGRMGKDLMWVIII